MSRLSEAVLVQLVAQHSIRRRRNIEYASVPSLEALENLPLVFGSEANVLFRVINFSIFSSFSPFFESRPREMRSRA